MADQSPEGWRIDVRHSWHGFPEVHEVAVYNDQRAMLSDWEFLCHAWGEFALVVITPLHLAVCNGCQAAGLVPERPPEGSYATCPECTAVLAAGGSLPDLDMVPEADADKTVEERLAGRGFEIVRGDTL